MSGSNTTKYQIRYRVKGTTMWSNYGPPVDTFSEAVTGLASGVTYELEVLSINSYGTVASEIIVFTMSNVAPSAPGLPTASNITQNSAVINWPQSLTGTQTISYQLYVGLHGGAIVAYGNPSTLTSAAVTGLAPNSQYDAYVTATNTAGTSAPSPTASFTTAQAVHIGTVWPASAAIRGAGAVAVAARRRTTGVVAITGAGTVQMDAVVRSESAQGTTVTNTVGVIYDATLNAWTLVTSAANGLQITENGVTDPVTKNVTLLLYWNHFVYQQTTSAWYQFIGGVWTLVPADPRIVESANGTTITSTTGSITDAIGDNWSLVIQVTAPTTNGRDPYLQPFASNDYWNIGIGSNAQWTTTSDPGTATLVAQFGMINTNGNFNVPFYLGQASDPLITLVCSDASLFPVATQHVHIPLGAKPADPPAGDRHMTFFDRTQPGKMFSCYACVLDHSDGNGGVSNTTTTITYGFGGVYDTTGSGVYPFGDTAFPALGTGTVGMDNYGIGTIRDWEISAGVIPHALRHTLPNEVLHSPGNTFTENIPWPNIAEDYCGGPTQFTGCSTQLYTGNISYGVTIGIPASVNLNTVGLTAGGLMIATALQKYGSVIRDAGSGAYTLYTETLSPANLAIVTNQMQPDMQKIVPLLRIMTNQSTDGIVNVNGGGTYPTPAIPIEASQGASLTGTVGYIIDNKGDYWSLVTSLSQGLRIYHTGALDGVTQNVTILLYWNHSMYQQNSAGNWYQWSGTVWNQVPGDPRIP